jgi:hypothetical protein
MPDAFFTLKAKAEISLRDASAEHIRTRWRGEK